MSDIHELIDSVLKIRQEKFENIPEELVRECLEIESQFMDERSEARKRLQRLIDSIVSREFDGD